MRWTRTLAALLVAAVAAGCATKPPASALAEGLRMIDLYRGTTPVGAARPGRRAATEGIGLVTCQWWLFTWPCEAPNPEPEPVQERSYARSAATELEALFPRLPNPAIYIYVPPHLATEARLPVPGYATAVPLYDRVEYALPGEMPSPTVDVRSEGTVPQEESP